jgi:hypothetical protein
MAPTKRKRRSKHRGNAAGTIESRGRTGRKLSDAERKPATKPSSTAAKRAARLDSPPTWRSAGQRAIVAALIFFVAILLVFHQKPVAAVSLACFMVLIYVPMGYYTDLILYRRRQRSKAAGKS